MSDAKPEPGSLTQAAGVMFILLIIMEFAALAAGNLVAMILPVGFVFLGLVIDVTTDEHGKRGGS